MMFGARSENSPVVMSSGGNPHNPWLALTTNPASQPVGRRLHNASHITSHFERSRAHQTPASSYPATEQQPRKISQAQARGQAAMASSFSAAELFPPVEEGSRPKAVAVSSRIAPTNNPCEDGLVVAEKLPGRGESLFAVVDGHGGPGVKERCACEQVSGARSRCPRRGKDWRGRAPGHVRRRRRDRP